MNTNSAHPTSTPATQAGAAVYTPMTLALYDLVVLRLSNPLVWRCPTRRILDLYDAHASGNHLDVGVGTGWYLDRCRFPVPTPRVALMDLNASSLAAAANRIARYRPETHQADVLKPEMPSVAPFASISMTYLLHCLPGDMASKGAVFDHLAPLLQPGGIVFGATLLSRGVERTKSAQALMRIYNRRSIFSNEADSLDELRVSLEQRFREVSLMTVGCAALFMGRGQRGGG